MVGFSGAGVQSDKDCLRALLLKQLVPLSLLVGIAALMTGAAADLDIAGIVTATSAIAPLQWVQAACAACVSFWAVGRMEIAVHRLIGADTAASDAQRSGIASVATAQLTGFGLLTGTLARWRTLPDITLWRAAAITGAVSASFMLALAVLVAVMVLIHGPEIAMARPIAAAWLVGMVALVACTIWRPRVLFRAWLPPLKAQVTVLALALLDTGAAALTLYVLLPAADLPPADLFYAVFLLALGAGLLGATPGGVGPFEMIVLLCLPDAPQAPVLAAIMGFRLVYYAVPGGIAALLLLAGPTNAARPAPRTAPMLLALGPPQSSVAVGALCFNAQRAEAGLLRQGEFDLLCDARRRPISLVAVTAQSLIMLSDPLARASAPRDALRGLQTAAQQRFLTPCLYKCGARMAAMARTDGWQVARVAQEAHVRPAGFDTALPALRQLRRQIRKAEKSGVAVAEAGAQLPIAEMRLVAQDWARHRGPSRGFSMGRFDADYISGQRVYLARHAGRLVAFASFHEGWSERALDLICHRADAPAGTMHLLIARAIQSAAGQGCDRLTLASVPCLGRSLPGPLAARLDAVTGAPGLSRFKSCFAPTWTPQYVAAPTRLDLALAGIDLADRITRPRILPEHS
ncbi:MAG: phosphatidylglycerol lysyltransferase domain-containing protein [Rhodobacter sp.]|nr:phosphatidylglycerol lysyltransferase domain-containing protein [Rhodobacter sp.]